MQFLVGCWEVWQALAGPGDEALRSGYGLSLREFIALGHVQGAQGRVEPCSPAGLAAALGMPRYEVSRTLARLEALGAVSRSRTEGADARQVQVDLTAHGAEMWRLALGTVQALVRPVLAPLGESLPQLGADLRAAAGLARQLAPAPEPLSSSSPKAKGHRP